MPPSLETTNAWLAVLAIAVVVQTLLMVGGAIVAWRMYARTTQALAQAVDQLEARHLTPLSARVNAVADDVQDVMARVRRADDAVRAQLDKLDTVAHVAGQAVGSRMWPVVGLSRAAAAAFRALSSRSSTRPSSADTPRVARLTPR